MLRTSPAKLTRPGETLLKHWTQVRELEQEALREIVAETENDRRIAVAVNNDSLYYWFKEIIPELIKKLDIKLEVQVADESKTQELLRVGKVSAAVSSQAAQLNGCKAELLGELVYRALATKEFKRKYFSKKPSGKTLSEAPHLIYNEDHFIS